ncbi:MAG: superoxide dismutase [Bacilli bacterium]|nr:superoxide dismutase [Bacilli bacterium]
MKEMIVLPYSYNALLPDINSEVLSIHFDKHYKGYVYNLNKYLKEAGFKNEISLEEIPSNIENFPINLRGDILYNAGGVLNHELYFKSMNPIKSDPKGNLLNKINTIYGSFEEFRRDFISRAKALVGSGYTFLVSNKRGDLTIINLVNQETPLSYNLIPLFALDLWEHAYYLQYKNDRDKYIENFWNKANFDNALKIYEEIVK